MSQISEMIYQQVLEAMQHAEELGGPEDDDYIDLMEAIQREAAKRVAAFKGSRA